MEEESWRRNHGGGIMEEESWRRNQEEGIMEELSGRLLGGIWGASWRASGRHPEASERALSAWGGLGGLGASEGHLLL